jgi:hydrogenase nickel incorporation protein HypA/HybF
MHEMGIAIQLIDSLEDLCKDKGLKKLRSVTLTLGEASMVVPRYMSECWDAAVSDTPFKDTQLKIITTVAHGRCNHCGKEFAIRKNEQKCPYCGTFNDFVPIDGMEIEITQLEAE